MKQFPYARYLYIYKTHFCIVFHSLFLVWHVHLTNLFSVKNIVSFKGYEHNEGLNIGQFWRSNSNIIIEKLLTQKREMESKENRTSNENEKLMELIELTILNIFPLLNLNNIYN